MHDYTPDEIEQARAVEDVLDLVVEADGVLAVEAAEVRGRDVVEGFRFLEGGGDA